MSVHWTTGAYKGPHELSFEIGLKGGLINYLNTYEALDGLPVELRRVAKALQQAHDICERVFQDAGVIVK